MNFLYDLLYRFREYFLLILLIVLSFILIISNDNTEVQGFRAKVTDTFGFVQRPFMALEQMEDLRAKNELLRQRNLELSMELQQRKEEALENERLRKLLQFQRESEFQVLPAEIINRGGSSIVNSVTINIGGIQGVKKDEAVVISEGVVGKTISVGENTSIVQLLTDVNFRLSVKTRRTRANGILVWSHDNICTIENVPKSLDIMRGDTIITSGYSDIFPEGMLVGKVIATSNEIPGFHKQIDIRTFVNFNELEEVFVIITKPEYTVNK